MEQNQNVNQHNANQNDNQQNANLINNNAGFQCAHCRNEKPFKEGGIRNHNHMVHRAIKRLGTSVECPYSHSVFRNRAEFEDHASSVH